VTPLYTRIHAAEQLAIVIEIMRKKYPIVFVEGHCSSSHRPIIAAEKIKIDGIILI
jgi:hypothetical protein